MFHKVLSALLVLAGRKIRLPAGDQVPAKIADNPKMTPYFDAALGAIDGSLFPVRVKASEQPAWQLALNGNLNGGKRTSSRLDNQIRLQIPIQRWRLAA